MESATTLDMVPEEGYEHSRKSPMAQFSQQSSNKIKINVGGMRHETYKSTLENIPDTRLAWIVQATAINNADYDAVLGEFFFDRHPQIFETILNYYRTGKLHVPIDVCGPVFEEELQFWGIDEKQIEPCCWPNYTQYRDAQETLAKLQGDTVENDEDDDEDVARIFGIEEERRKSRNWYQRWQPKIWLMLEEPFSSRAAKTLALISLMFVTLSITAFCMETSAPFQELVNNTRTGEEHLEPIGALFAIEGVCVIFFTIELFVRFTFCPKKCHFFITMETIIDILACVPFYVDAIFKMIGETNSASGSDVLNFLRIVRIFRIFRLARHLSGLQILVHTLKASANELLLLIIFLGLGVLISSSLVYYAERWVAEPEAQNDFHNIPIGFWWAVVTMTTVGYGDRVPRTWLGMMIGAATAIIGVLTLALPVPVIVNNFALYYTQAQARLKLPKKRKRVLIGAADALKTHVDPQHSSSISGYSTQSTIDTISIKSEDGVAVKTVSGNVHKSTSSSLSPVTTSGEKTGITVTFIDEGQDTPKLKMSPNTETKHGNKLKASGALLISNFVASKRTLKRASLIPGVSSQGRNHSVSNKKNLPNGDSEGKDGAHPDSMNSNGSAKAQRRRKSLLPSSSLSNVEC